MHNFKKYLQFGEFDQKLMIDHNYYRTATTQSSSCFCCLKNTFNLRFPFISQKGNLVNGNCCQAMCGMIKWKCNYTNQGIPSDEYQLNTLLPMVKPIFTPSAKDKIRYTWIGHSTAVISFGNNINFIIDPVFSERCSPFQWIGPKRFRPPACSVAQLPHIDCVLVSHDHYDHLEEDTLNELYQRFNPQFFAGLQSSDVFPRNCKMNQLDWTDSVTKVIKGLQIKITFVPVAHWSRRWMFDKNKRLWGGFVIQFPGTKKQNTVKIFYSGDTGYCQIFQQLGDIFGGFDLAILPIGAYLPREFLANQHIDPNEAVKVHKEIKSKKSVGVHWGTFPLGFQHFAAAKFQLQKVKKNQGLDQQQFITVNHGGSFQIDG